MIPNPPAIARYVNKANVVTAAWKALFGVLPSLPAVATAMAIAEFETHMGDAGGSWKGEHNWGAVHKRGLTQGESAALKAQGITPDGGDAALARARGVLAPTAPDEALHIDHSPQGAYFVWFWAFPSDVEAAKKYLHILVAQRPQVRALLEGNGSAADVVRAMYGSKYFSGVKADPEANIADYARNVAARLEPIQSALSLTAWQPSKADAPLEDPSTVAVLKTVAEERLVDAAREAQQASHGFAPLVAIGLLLGGGLLVAQLATKEQTRRMPKRTPSEVL